MPHNKVNIYNIKPLEFKISPESQAGFLLETFEDNQFYPSLHFHNEVQITHIQSSKGSVISGYETTTYKEGDILIFGSRVPHVLKKDSTSNVPCRAFSIYIKKSIEQVSQFLDVTSIQRLLNFEGLIKIPENIKIKKLINSVSEKSSFHASLTVLEILYEITQISSRQEISIMSWEHPADSRINRVLDYTFANYSDEIRIATVAELIHMSEPAFCRLFKKYTRKSYIQFLNEIRIKKACELLLSTEQSIAEVAFNTGFRNLSNFNRKFKRITGSRPLDYKIPN